jgi:exosortase
MGDKKTRCSGNASSEWNEPLPLTSFVAQRRWLVFCLWVAFLSLLYWGPFLGIFSLATHDDTYSYLLLIPFIFAWLLFIERKQAPEEIQFSLWPSAAFLALGALFALLGIRCISCSQTTILSIYSLSFVLLLIGGFVLIFGKRKAWASFFPLSFLIFVIPIPNFLLGGIIYWLQSGSAAVASFLFDLSGAPVLREGFFFRLPKISIEVAQECSGIRSSLALLILALLVAHFTFRSFWRKLVFVIAGLCMMLIKNGIRIASLTLLANYVDPNFLYGRLHHQGGVVFFLVGLILLLPVYWFLRKSEVPPAQGTLQTEN